MLLRMSFGISEHVQTCLKIVSYKILTCLNRVAFDLIFEIGQFI